MKFTFKFSKGPSTANALVKFTEALDELNAVVDAEQVEIDVRNVEIDRLHDEVFQAKQRQQHAKRVSDRLAGLLA